MATPATVDQSQRRLLVVIFVRFFGYLLLVFIVVTDLGEFKGAHADYFKISATLGTR